MDDEINEYIAQQIKRHGCFEAAMRETTADMLAAIEFALDCQTRLHRAELMVSAGFVRGNIEGRQWMTTPSQSATPPVTP